MTQPVYNSPASPVQKAIVAILRGDATLTGLLAPIKGVTPPTPAIVDGPPEGQAYPYVSLGDHLSIGDDDLTSFGRQISETLHVWTKTRSMIPGQTIASRISALLNRQHGAMSTALAAAGHRCVSIKLTYDQAMRDPDPEIRHHVLRFEVTTAQLE